MAPLPNQPPDAIDTEQVGYSQDRRPRGRPRKQPARDDTPLLRECPDGHCSLARNAADRCRHLIGGITDCGPTK